MAPSCGGRRGRDRPSRPPAGQGRLLRSGDPCPHRLSRDGALMRGSSRSRPSLSPAGWTRPSSSIRRPMPASPEPRWRPHRTSSSSAPEWAAPRWRRGSRRPAPPSSSWSAANGSSPGTASARPGRSSWRTDSGPANSGGTGTDNRSIPATSTMSAATRSSTGLPSSDSGARTSRRGSIREACLQPGPFPTRSSSHGTAGPRRSTGCAGAWARTRPNRPVRRPIRTRRCPTNRRSPAFASA